MKFDVEFHPRAQDAEGCHDVLDALVRLELPERHHPHRAVHGKVWLVTRPATRQVIDLDSPWHDDGRRIAADAGVVLESALGTGDRVHTALCRRPTTGKFEAVLREPDALVEKIHEVHDRRHAAGGRGLEDTDRAKSERIMHPDRVGLPGADHLGQRQTVAGMDATRTGVIERPLVDAVAELVVEHRLENLPHVDAGRGGLLLEASEAQ